MTPGVTTPEQEADDLAAYDAAVAAGDFDEAVTLVAALALLRRRHGRTWPATRG